MHVLRVDLIGPPGRRNYKKRFTVLCPACGSVVLRAGWSCTSAQHCGCLPNFHQKHGLHNHPLYLVWHGMKDRCLNPNGKDWSKYGARGIQICPEWIQFEPFFQWASSRWQPGLLLDRENNNGNYTPSNCRFTSILESNRNRSNVTITKDQAIQIHEMLDAGHRVYSIASALNVPRGTVKTIKAGRAWKKEQL